MSAAWMDKTYKSQQMVRKHEKLLDFHLHMLKAPRQEIKVTELPNWYRKSQDKRIIDIVMERQRLGNS